MSETKEQRAARVRDWSSDSELCVKCGYRRINVRHEPDPDNAPEGGDYYAALRPQMHPFEANR